MKGFFNRYESMSRVVLREITNINLDLILVDCETWDIQNMLSGFYDGYDYTDVLPECDDMNALKEVDGNLHNRILMVCEIVSKYPRSKEQEH